MGVQNAAPSVVAVHAGMRRDASVDFRRYTKAIAQALRAFTPVQALRIRRHLVATHQRHGNWRQVLPTLEGAAISEHLREAEVITRGGDKTTTAGDERRTLGLRRQRPKLAKLQLAGGVVLVGFRHQLDVFRLHVEVRVLHSQRVEQALLEVVVKRHAANHLHQTTENIVCHAVAPAFARMIVQRQLGNFGSLLCQRGTVT